MTTTTFTLDTSGVAMFGRLLVPEEPDEACDMLSFEVENKRLPGFSDLAPETLAAILRDCEAFLKTPGQSNRDGDGRSFWALRQKGLYAHIGFPPLNPYLGDDGKVYLRKTA